MDAHMGPARPLGLGQAAEPPRDEMGRRQNEASRRAELFRRAFNASPTASAIISLEGRYEDANPAFIELISTRCGRSLEVGAADLLCGRMPADPVTVIRAFASTDGGHHQLERRLVTPDGQWRWIRLQLDPIPDATGEATHLLLEAEDVTERRRQTSALTGLALRDPLTGLANRARFDQAVREAAVRANDAVLLFVDLDRFKQINDNHGHAFGDAVLIEVARRLEASLDLGCIAGRLGGDEFAVLATEASLPHGRRVAGRIQDLMAEPIVVEGTRVKVTASIGIASVADRDAATTDLLVEADTAMYRAKAQGGNRTAIFNQPGSPRLRLAYAAPDGPPSE